MGSKKKSYPLRIDPELFAVIEKWADDEFRSINLHMEYLLREAARKAGRLPKRGLPPLPPIEDQEEDEA